jgi:hypothetical protein
MIATLDPQSLNHGPKNDARAEGPNFLNAVNSAAPKSANAATLHGAFADQNTAQNVADALVGRPQSGSISDPEASTYPMVHVYKRSDNTYAVLIGNENEAERFTGIHPDGQRDQENTRISQQYTYTFISTHQQN